MLQTQAHPQQKIYMYINKHPRSVCSPSVSSSRPRKNRTPATTDQQQQRKTKTTKYRILFTQKLQFFFLSIQLNAKSAIDRPTNKNSIGQRNEMATTHITCVLGECVVCVFCIVYPQTRKARGQRKLRDAAAANADTRLLLK